MRKVLSGRAKERVEKLAEFVLEQQEQGEKVEALVEAQRRTESEVSSLSTQIGSVAETLARVEQGLSRLEEELVSTTRETLERASRERERLTEEFFERSVIDPLCQAVFPSIDFARECFEEARKSPRVAEKFANLSTLLTQVLAQFGVEELPEEENALLDDSFMEVAERKPVPHKALDRRVDVLSGGYRRNGKLLRRQRVIVSQFANANGAAREVS